jgi:hypothetical protein
MATKLKSRKGAHSNIRLRGFFRLQITEEGKIVGDSGWKENQVTNLGIQDYLVNPLMGASGKNVSHMALGTGAAPASDATSLSGEITHATNSRKTVSTSVVSSRTAQFTAAFNSADSFVTTTINISNIGLFHTSTTAAGTIFAGNTYASSSLATNQNVNATYQIRFS